MTERAYERWETVEDPRADLSAFEVSSLGRVRRCEDRRMLKVQKVRGRENKPHVSIWANRYPHKRVIHSLVARAFGETQAQVADAAVQGLQGLLDLRDELEEKLELVEEAIGLVAFGRDPLLYVGPLNEPPSPRPSIEAVAMEEARILGEALRDFRDSDPFSEMTREEKCNRLARLRAVYGRGIEQASGFSLQHNP